MPESILFSTSSPPGDRRGRRLWLHARAVREILRQRFPDAFRARGADKPPLKIGIGRDVQLAMPELPPAVLAVALRDYASGPTYCRNLVAGARRIGLDGEAAGCVSEAEAKLAAYRMKLFERNVALEKGAPDTEKEGA